MATAYIAFGSNIHPRFGRIVQGLDLLRQKPLIEVVRYSPLYVCSPVGMTATTWFINGVIEIDTSLSPVQLLNRLLEVEETCGRRRTGKRGDRTLDFDILLYNQVIFNDARLVIPHPRLAERRFVLEPLCQLCPRKRHPQLAKSFIELLQEGDFPGQAVYPYSPDGDWPPGDA